MDVADVELDEQSSEDIEPLQPRKRGRPSGSKTKKIPRDTSTVGSTRYKNYYTGHHNKAQDTQAAWAWIDDLHDDQKQIIDLTVYRDWPVLKLPLAPPEGAKRKNPKSIAEQIPGTEAFKTDQDLVHMFGAGNYRVYVNVNPPGGARRELFCAVVKATHDFRAFPPTDWRIDNIEEVDLADPSNGSYVAWLRSQGKVPDEAKDKQEADEMAAGNAVMAEIVKDALADRREMTQKLIEQTERANEIPADPPPSQKEVLTDAVSMLKSIKELVPTADPMAMMQQVISTAQILLQSKDNSAEIKPLLEQINSLRDQMRAQESAALNAKLNELSEQLRALKETPQNPNVLLPDGSNLNSIVEKAVAKAVENGLGESDNSWWVDPLKQLMPVAVPALIQGLGNFLRPAPPPAFPMPPATYQAGAPQQQAQLPAPAQPQQAAPQPQAGGAFTTGNAPLDNLLMQITVPLADALRDGDSGSDFAEFFISEFGYEIFTQLSSFGVDPVVTILYSYPPLTSTLKPLPREDVTKFISEFIAHKPSKTPAGGAA